MAQYTILVKAVLDLKLLTFINKHRELTIRLNGLGKKNDSNSLGAGYVTSQYKLCKQMLALH